MGVPSLNDLAVNGTLNTINQLCNTIVIVHEVSISKPFRNLVSYLSVSVSYLSVIVSYMSVRVSYLSVSVSYLSVSVSYMSVRVSYLSVSVSYLSVRVSCLSVRVSYLSVRVSCLSVRVSYLSVRVSSLSVRVSYLSVRVDGGVALLAFLAAVSPAVPTHPCPVTLSTRVLPEAAAAPLVRRQASSLSACLDFDKGYIKVRGPFFQTLCIEKDSYMDAI